ncbi:hypothetical protein FRC01_007285 [Tulasnella sp. 417]|nr:hypothetical protein FRC01_007285 [Tulasnella sp. 417]
MYLIIITPISVVRKIQFTNTMRMEATGEITSGKPAVNPALVGFAGVLFSLSGFVDAILYVITRPSILRSFLSCFQFNVDPAEIDAPPSAKDQHQAGAPSPMTVPEVTVNSSLGFEFALREGGFQNGRRYGGNSATEGLWEGHPVPKGGDYGLPTLTVMSENHLTPPSLRTRGAVVGCGSERTSYTQQEATSSSASAKSESCSSGGEWIDGTAAES